MGTYKTFISIYNFQNSFCTNTVVNVPQAISLASAAHFSYLSPYSEKGFVPWIQWSICLSRRVSIHEAWHSCLPLSCRPKYCSHCCSGGQVHHLGGHFGLLQEGEMSKLHCIGRNLLPTEILNWIQAGLFF